jgi:hypothetical protein
VQVGIYPVAFLQAEITSITPSSTVLACSEFVVNYTVTNFGEADAWMAGVTLTVNPEGSVRPTTGGYSQFLGTIRGWNFGENLSNIDYQFATGSFTLHCTEQGLSTLTITPWGNDECGWHALVGSVCEGFNGDSECEPQYNWVQFANLPIQSRFLKSYSETITGGGEVVVPGTCPDLTTVNLQLNTGWNLISLPLMPNSGNISTVLSGVKAHTVIVWAYDTSAGWKFFDPTDVGASTLTQMKDGLGYWVNMNAVQTLTINGKVNPLPPATPPTYAVAAGWNLIGFKSTCARPAMDYLGSTPWVRIWGYSNGAWVSVQGANALQPGQGYWIAATGAGMIFP